MLVRIGSRIAIPVAVISLVGVLAHARAEDAGVSTEDRLSFDDLYSKLIVALEGPSVSVLASPALCEPLSPEPAGAEAYQRWLFGEGCIQTFEPNPFTLITPVTEGASSRFAGSADLRAQVEGLLANLQSLADRGVLTPTEQLLAHSTAWEIAYGLEKAVAHHPERRAAVRPTVDHAFRLLISTRFQEDEIGKLPSTLNVIPRLSGVEELQRTVETLEERPSEFLEVVPPTDLHADMLLGRFTSRIFLRSRDSETQRELAEYLDSPDRGYTALRNLPQRFPGIQAVLLLYFNVFDQSDRLLPTETVAFWLEYTFSGRASYDQDYAEAARQIEFVVVAAERQPALDLAGGPQENRLTYRRIDQQATARLTFLDVKPTRTGTPTTVVRANCLRCHRYQIATFDTHSIRPVSFDEPLSRHGRELLTPFFRRIEDTLSEWRRGHPDEPGASTQADVPGPQTLESP